VRSPSHPPTVSEEDVLFAVTLSWAANAFGIDKLLATRASHVRMEITGMMDHDGTEKALRFVAPVFRIFEAVLNTSTIPEQEIATLQRAFMGPVRSYVSFIECGPAGEIPAPNGDSLCRFCPREVEWVGPNECQTCPKCGALACDYCLDVLGVDLCPLCQSRSGFL
jgi:hypothetical protein